ncbi:ArnT family glycosyltransferase [Dyadobacter luticola]|uniref:ArnT family glycosyltransferase n=1 Tax=Dyadobacter luticola TaxID=1979387 RepID=UPI001486621F|nr:glycosyltransferase family 39 protein [Dyadobacter luticola]
MISSLVLVAVKIQASLGYHPDISGSEGSTIAPIQLLTADRDIYLDPESAPFRLTQYTPLYFVIVAFCCKLVNWSAVDVHYIYLASRFLSNIFSLLAVSVIGLLVFNITKKKIAGFLSALFLYQILSSWFLTISRPDSLLVLLISFYLWAAYLALKDRANDNWWFLVIFISVSAFFVKQSGAILSITPGLFWILNRQWKTLAKLTLFGFAVFGLYLLILPVNNVALFFTNIIGGVANSASWNWFYDWTLQHWLLQFAPLLVANALVSAYIIYRKSSPFYLFLTLASFMFLVFSTMAAFKIGAGVGYYQDYLMVSVLQITLFICETYNKPLFNNVFLKAGLSLYLLVAFFYCPLFVHMKYKAGNYMNFEGIYIEERDVANYLYSEKKLQDGDWVYVCPGENFRGYFLNQFLVKNILIPFPDLVFLADKNGTFRYDKFKSMAVNKQIKYVIANKGTKPVNIFDFDFGQSLRYSSTIGSFDIYEANN